MGTWVSAVTSIMKTLIFFFHFVLFTTFLGFAKSRSIQFDHPNIEDVLEPGLTCTISWRLNQSGPQNFTHVDLYLIQFIFGRFYLLEPIAYEVNVTENESIDWEIPRDGILNGQYAIGAIAFGCDYQSYSDHFWIIQDY
jgi:hypothetical protein